MSRKSSSHYIDGARFTQLSVEALETGHFPEELVDMFYLLAAKSFNHGRGVPRHSFMPLEESDAVQEAVMACIMGTKTFTPEKGGAYTFFRSIIRSCYIHLHETATREKRNPGNDIFNIDSHVDIETDNRVSFLLMESQKQSEQPYKKLQPPDIRDIKRRLAAGEVGAVIARDYDVDPSTISKIKTGKLWGDV